MPRLNHKSDSLPGIEIYFWKIEESVEELSYLIGDGRLLLTEAQNRFKAPARQREWLAVRALLQQTPYKELEIAYHSNGKPHFGNSNKHISISHTQEFAAIAVADKPIGIDIESKKRNAHVVADAFLQPQEIESLQARGDEKNEALRLWTAKEAAFKLSPDKSVVLKDIMAHLLANDTTEAATYHITYKEGTIAHCHTTEEADFVLSICTQE